MTSLDRVQNIYKAFKILTQIGMVYFFVAAGFELVIASLLISVNFQIIDLSLLNSFYIGYDRFSLSISMFSNMVLLFSGGIVLSNTVKYFKNELADGTPFTLRGAKELKFLGIKTIAYPLGAKLITEIIYMASSSDRIFTNSHSYSIEYGLSVTLILISFVFRYGAELEEKVKKHENNLSVE